MSANGSKLEKAVGDLLDMQAISKQLVNLKEQVKVQICCRDPECKGNRSIFSIVDFCSNDPETGDVHYHEAKGFETPEWRLKRRLWLHNGPGPLTVYKGSYKSFKVHETLIPNE